MGAVCGDPNLVCYADGSCETCDVCSSGCAFTTIQAGINAANNGATIHLCPGAFTENITINDDLTPGGAGDGTGSGNAILDGNQNGTVVTIGDGPSVTLQGLHITNGDATTAGGIVNQGTLTLIACTVAGNDAVEGGGIFNEIGTVTLNSGSSVTNNNPDNCAGETVSGCSG